MVFEVIQARRKGSASLTVLEYLIEDVLTFATKADISDHWEYIPTSMMVGCAILISGPLLNAIFSTCFMFKITYLATFSECTIEDYYDYNTVSNDWDEFGHEPVHRNLRLKIYEYKQIK